MRFKNFFNLFNRKKNKIEKIFIAHNDKDPILNDLAIFLQKLKYFPIILQKEPNIGVAIFDKFKNISYQAAIVILREDQKLKEKTNLSRAKQNVIWEMGFCYARLKDPKKILILYDEKAEIPSNISGIEYTKLDEDWKLSLLEAIFARAWKRFEN